MLFHRFFVATLFVLFVYLGTLRLPRSLTDQAISFTYNGISGILRSNLTALAYFNDTIVLGDFHGALLLWEYNSKKETLIFKAIDRTIAPVLPQQNLVVKVVLLENKAAIRLTEDGVVSIILISSQQTFTNRTILQLNETTNNIDLINITHLLTISNNNKTLCIYSSRSLLEQPNPLNRLSCNTTTDSYSGVSFSAGKQLVATGNSSSVIIFDFKEKELKYLMEVNIPRADDLSFVCRWTQADLLIVDNGLWLNSIMIDLEAGFGRLLSSQRLQSLLGRGQSDQLAIFEASKSQPTILVNGHSKGAVFTLTAAGKLIETNESRAIGKVAHFALLATDRFISTTGQVLNMVLFSNNEPTDNYFKLLREVTMNSSNHFAAVNAFAVYANFMASVSEGGDGNFRLWSIKDNKPVLLDLKTETYLNLLKVININFKSLLMLPPKTAQHKLLQVAKNFHQITQTLHIVAAGAEPFCLFLFFLSPNGTIVEGAKTTEEHAGNVTCLFLSDNQKYIISGAKDTLLNLWTVETDRKTVNRSTTVRTNLGPISFGIMDRLKTHLILGHDSTFTNVLANISIWKFDQQTGKLTKLAQNVPGEAHQANMTGFVLSKDEKYLVTLSQKGELKLWRHENWTMVDLLASLSLGFTNSCMTLSESNRVILETATGFHVYDFDQNGFIFNSRTSKLFDTNPTITFTRGSVLYSGDGDGAIRLYTYTE